MTAPTGRTQRPALHVPALRAPAPLVRPGRQLLGGGGGTRTRDQDPIREQTLHRVTLQEASEVLTAAGGAAISRMHATTHDLVVETAGLVIQRTEALPPSTLRQVIDAWNAVQLPAYTRHMHGVLEAGAFAVAETIAHPFDETISEPPGFWRRLFGDS
ncbi:MAG: hypothetical protein JNM64_06170 [Chloroflexia bacterium]|nr:hypothetical protein [Chloroflexia bacterium]